MERHTVYGKDRTIKEASSTKELSAFLLRGSMRRRVFDQVEDRKNSYTTTPTTIAKNLAQGKVSAGTRAQISRALKELEIQGLITCVNPEEKTGRIYKKTTKGKHIKKIISE